MTKFNGKFGRQLNREKKRIDPRNQHLVIGKFQHQILFIHMSLIFYWSLFLNRLPRNIHKKNHIIHNHDKIILMKFKFKLAVMCISISSLPGWERLNPVEEIPEQSSSILGSNCSNSSLVIHVQYDSGCPFQQIRKHSTFPIPGRNNMLIQNSINMLFTR